MRGALPALGGPALGFADSRWDANCARVAL